MESGFMRVDPKTLAAASAGIEPVRYKGARAKGDPNPEREPPRFPRTHSLRKRILAREFFPNLLVQNAGLLPHETSPFAVRRRATEPDHPE